MKLWIGFAGGLAVGVVGTVLAVSALSTSVPSEAHPPAQGPAFARPGVPHATAPSAPVSPLALMAGQRQSQAEPLRRADASALQVDAVLGRLAADPEAAFDDRALQDLSCSMRRDPQAAAQVRARLLGSSSATERFALMRLLAQDDSPETAALVRGLIGAADHDTKRLGYDLLRSVEGASQRPELTQALLAALQQETEPAYLSELIGSLSRRSLDDMGRSVAAQRLQSILAGSHAEARASALLALPQLVDAPTAAVAVRQHLQDPDATVRLAALQAALAMNASTLDADVVSMARRLSLSASEPEAVRSVAQVLLARAALPRGS
ncbi:hypothetical protein ACG02S_08430 [Roseateles sp. DC23W]|uniref:HEAT repeat n=1 Tax=Pelomonas dachongensis TaxID=3299029 RepID=A0ABW7EKL3_9BURK